MDIDELVNMMGNQSLICSDENSRVLAESFETVASILRDPESHNIGKYLIQCRNRYQYYMEHVAFKGYFDYLGKEIKEFIATIGEKSEYLSNSTDVHTLLLMTYFIDCELNQATGRLTLDKEDIDMETEVEVMEI